MNESQISVRYAKALFKCALEKGQLDHVFNDMELLTSVCKRDEFNYLLALPTLQPSRKIKLMEAIFKEYFSKISLSMATLVIKNKREAYLTGIARNFRDLYRSEKGIRSATLITAQPVDEPVLDKIRGLIRKSYDAEVELSSSVKGDVIGGFILTVGDMQYDASVASHLRKLKKQLLQTSIEK